MKRILGSLALMCLVTGVVMAAPSNPHNGVITISCAVEYSVDVTTTDVYNATDNGNTIALGEVATGITCVSPKCFYIWNTSSSGRNTVQSYTLSHAANAAINDAGFAGGLNTLAVAGIFATAAPAQGAFSATHLITGSAQAWVNDGRYDSADYTNSHSNPTPGTSTAVNLWPAIATPNAISAAFDQTITIVVLAGAPQ